MIYKTIQMNEIPAPAPLLELFTSTGRQVINSNTIIRIAAISNYSRLYFDGGKTLVVAKTLCWFEQRMPQPFLRIHRGHLVNPQFIQRYLRHRGGKVMLHNGEHIGVSRRKRNYFLEYWQTVGV
jgi:two-component system, LytTR family, response regulator